MDQLELVLDAQNLLGEGPVWNVQQQALYWLDIRLPVLYKYFPAQNTSEQVTIEHPITVLGFCAHNGKRLITASASGFAFLDAETGAFQPITDPEAHKPETRFNDGAVDPAGRFWAGSMNEADMKGEHNALYRLDPDLSLRVMVENVALSNGIGWSPDKTIMYFSDTGLNQIFKYSYDVTTGAIENRQVFAEIPDGEGSPDGLTVDAEGCVWNALWGGGKVIRFSPEGKRLLEVEIPASQVTSCAFGGVNLDELYITTARTGLSDEALRDKPLSGGLFRLKPGVRGMVEPLFAGG